MWSDLVSDWPKLFFFSVLSENLNERRNLTPQWSTYFCLKLQNQRNFKTTKWGNCKRFFFACFEKWRCGWVECKMSVGVRPSACLVVTKRQKIGAQPPSYTSTVSHREFWPLKDSISLLRCPQGWHRSLIFPEIT